MDDFSDTHVETIINFRAVPGKKTSRVGCGLGACRIDTGGVICRRRGVVDAPVEIDRLYPRR